MITDAKVLHKESLQRSEATWIDNLSKKLLCRTFNKIKSGFLTIRDQSDVYEFGDPQSELRAHIHVSHPGFWTNVSCTGTIGSGISYQSEQWSCDNLTALVRIISRNQEVMLSLDGTLVQWLSPIRKMLHRINRNTVKDAKQHIKAHYDIGNNLFKHMLDSRLMYSAAIYESSETDLETASAHKLDVICKKLELEPSDHIIEIGTGWGGFAIYAAEHYGCEVTTTTISDEQYALAVERAKQSPAKDRITILNKDYRLLEGTYDKLVSIEMIEAVGHQFYKEFFSVCSRLLKPSGVGLIQAITVEDQEFDRAKREVDFIKKFIFPGCCIPSVTALLEAATASSDLHLHSLEDYSAHYARTLADWRNLFNKNIDAIEAEGYSKPFQRLWEFYLSYCEGGFAERYIQSKHLTFVKPHYRNAEFEQLGYA